jgi:SAM-dependent methyltransferase
MGPVARYYAEKLTAHGSTPQGVDWNSDESQQLRLTQLLRVMEGDWEGTAPRLSNQSVGGTEEAKSGPEARECTLLDYGCGYGALARRLIAEDAPFRYLGFDVCTPMVERARADVRDPRCTFTDSDEDLPVVDYTVASGVFNVRLGASEEEWEAHVVDTVGTLARHSRRGFAFNMLTRYADRERMRDYLYYADPSEYFGLCKERWSRNVALLHDYDLYEFTLLVRMGSEPTSLSR